jgi:hypothetical protein
VREGRFEIAARASTGVSPPGGRPPECRAAGGGVRVEIGEGRGVAPVPWRVFQRLLPERPTPERCVEAYYVQRTRFERIAQQKLRRRQLTEDGNVEISGRGLREGQSRARVMNRSPPGLPTEHSQSVSNQS